jgi:hypothetical protein
MLLYFLFFEPDAGIKRLESSLRRRGTSDITNAHKLDT